jgi:CHAD domain-containing protein
MSGHKSSGWQTFCRNNLAVCEHALLLANGPIDADVVHEIRVSCKKLRAAWQWLRPTLKKSLCSKRNAALASLAASLADTRDQTVMADTLDRLLLDASAGQKLAIGYAHRRLLAVTDSSVIEVPVIPVPILEEERLIWKRLAEQKPHKDWWDAGYQRVLQRAAVLSMDACLNNHEDSFHQWRKWVKYEFYASQLAGEETLTCGMKKKAAKIRMTRLPLLHRLGSELGEFHDLTELRDTIAGLMFPRKRPAWPDTVIAMLDNLIVQGKEGFAKQRQSLFADPD